jgi:hypothetical protein
LATGGVLAGLGVLLGIGIPWVIGAGIAAWATSALLHLRDPKLVSALLEPQFDRDLSILDAEHLRYMKAGLRARDRFETAAHDLPGDDDFAGMRTRITEALRRMYDSVVWSQRASRFLKGVDQNDLRRRLQNAGDGSRLAEELSEQLDEIDNIRRRREETVSRIRTTTTGIETLAVKMGSFALGSAAPGQIGAPDTEVRRLREELDTYVDALAEVERLLPEAMPDELA